MKSLEQYIESYDEFSLMLNDENDSGYINEASQVNKIKPLGYINDFNYNDKKFEQHRQTLLNCISTSTAINDNNDANGNIVFRYSYKDNNLYKCKFLLAGKNDKNLNTPKVINKEKISDNQEKIYEILFGFAHKDEDLSTLEKLINFICSKEYKNSNQESIKYIFDQFLTSCYEQKLKTYGLKKYVEDKLKTII